MNIKLADRLVTLRKENKLSQEALAEKLGLSRQAISKWERAEASPDTDNLIALAALYGISLDELLGNEVTTKDEKKNKEKKPLTEAQIKGKKHLSRAPLLLLLAIAVYVVGGILLGTKWWAVMWILFLLVLGFALASLAKFVETKKAWSIILMALAVTLCATSIYVFLGMLFTLWNIAWVVFLTIPAYIYTALIKLKTKKGM